MPLAFPTVKEVPMAHPVRCLTGGISEVKTIRTISHVAKWVLLCSILFIAFWIRIQGVSNIPTGQFTETDAYLYYWQAELVNDTLYRDLAVSHRRKRGASSGVPLMDINICANALPRVPCLS